ncbi:MAG: hypothetical protein HY275_14235 [Gemmatimonadetes bacterium]|nr:hypothetical protein [Gemmatimonadota bacterium]
MVLAQRLAAIGIARLRARAALAVAGALLAATTGRAQGVTKGATHDSARTPRPLAMAPDGLVTPDGWLGIALECGACGWTRNAANSAPMWYGGLAKVVGVEPGSSGALAGLTIGDVIERVNGRSIVERSGAEAFGAIHPGDRVTLHLLRRGSWLDVTLVAGERRGGPSSTGPVRGQALRYAAPVGDTQVDVWSSDAVSVDRDPNGDLVIRTATATVRVRPRSAEAGRPEATRRAP